MGYLKPTMKKRREGVDGAALISAIKQGRSMTMAYSEGARL
jgi:hypothetical protein